MYEKYYGFNEKPFSLTPDPRFFYLSKHHQGALDHMIYGVRQKEGFMAIIGDVGTGKTTLCRCLLDRLDANITVALILNPMLSDIDLLRTCVNDLNIKPHRLKINNGKISRQPDSSPVVNLMAKDGEEFSINQFSKMELIQVLNAFLLKQHEQGKTTVLIIDEAQNLPLDVMEQLRILSNLETEREKLLQIIFVGQLELNEKLNKPDLKQLNQRISIRYQISPLTEDETRNYINHRLMVASAMYRIRLTNSALSAIYNYSKGYPRLINLVCDRALLSGYNAQVDAIDGVHVKQGIRSLLGVEDTKSFGISNFNIKAVFVASVFFFLAGISFFWFGLGLRSNQQMQVSGASLKRESLKNASLAASNGQRQVFSKPKGKKKQK